MQHKAYDMLPAKSSPLSRGNHCHLTPRRLPELFSVLTDIHKYLRASRVAQW